MLIPELSPIYLQAYTSSGIGMYSVSLWISIIASPLNLSSVIEERVQSLRRQRAKNDRSQETITTGVVRKIRAR